jgi:hypothetical protein
VGVVKKIRTVGEVSSSAIEDIWQRQATAAAIAAARGVVQMDGPIPPGTPIGRLSERHRVGMDPCRDVVCLDL